MAQIEFSLGAAENHKAAGLQTGLGGATLDEPVGFGAQPEFED